MYNVYIDGNLWCSYAHVKMAKQWADDMEDVLNWFSCEIRRHKKPYSFRFYNTKWTH